MATPKVLVTGGSGLLGRFVVDALMADHQVAVLDIKPPAQDVAYHDVDVRDLEAVRAAVQGHERIIHLAGIDDGVDVPEHTYFSINVQGTWNLLHAAEELGGVGKVVIASSTAATGLEASAPPHYLPIDEAHPQAPKRTYDLTKQLIERTAESFARRGGIASIVSLRPTLIVRPEKVPEILAELATLSPEEGHPGIIIDAPIYGGLPMLRTYVTSRDCAKAFRAALLAKTAAYATYLVAARDTLGRVDAIGWMERQFAQMPEIRDAGWFAIPTASPLDSRAAERDLGWIAADDWPSVIRSVTG